MAAVFLSILNLNKYGAIVKSSSFVMASFFKMLVLSSDIDFA